MKYIKGYVEHKKYCIDGKSPIIQVRIINTTDGYWYKLGEIYDVFEMIYKTDHNDNYYMRSPWDGYGIAIEDCELTYNFRKELERICDI